MTEYGKTPQTAIIKRQVQSQHAGIRNIIVGLALATLSTAFIGIQGENTLTEIKPPKSTPSFISAIQSEDDLLTGNTNYFLGVDSITTVANSIGIQEKATIVARCQNGKLDVFVSTPSYNADHENISIRWNNRDVTNDSWSKASSSDALFANKPRAFLVSASRANTLVFGWVPYQKQKTAAKWNFTDQNKADFKSMLNQCT